MTMMSAGDWALLWANHENNGMSWANIVQGIREEMVLNMHNVDEVMDPDETTDTPLRSTLDTVEFPLCHCPPGYPVNTVAAHQCKPVNPVQDSFR